MKHSQKYVIVTGGKFWHIQHLPVWQKLAFLVEQHVCHLCGINPALHVQFEIPKHYDREKTPHI